MLYQSSNLAHQFAKKCKSAGLLLYSDSLYPFTDSYYVLYRTGILQYYSPNSASSFFPVLPFQQYGIFLSTYYGGDGGLAFYDSKFNYISGFLGNQSNYNKFTIPTGACYLRFSVFTIDKSSYIFKTYSI